MPRIHIAPTLHHFAIMMVRPAAEVLSAPAVTRFHLEQGERNLGVERRGASDEPARRQYLKAGGPHVDPEFGDNDVDGGDPGEAPQGEAPLFGLDHKKPVDGVQEQRIALRKEHRGWVSCSARTSTAWAMAA